MRLALVLPLLASPAMAEGTIIVGPISAQPVAVPVPGDFRAGFEQENNGAHILELTPPDETVDRWTKLITVTGGKGLGRQTSVIDMATQFAQGYQSACPDSFSAHQMPPPTVRGASALFSGYRGCGSVGGQSEAMVYPILQAKSEIYALQWVEHGPAQPKPAEPAPYPSCTE